MSKVVPVNYEGNQIGTAEVEIVNGELHVLHSYIESLPDILKNDFSYYSIDEDGENLIDCE